MTENSKNISFEERAIDFVTDSETSLEDLKLRLIDRGVNPEKLSDRFQLFVSKMKKSCRLEKLQKAEEERLTAAMQVRETANRFKDWSRTQILEKINSLTKKPQVYAFFRELDINSMSKEDLGELLTQIDDEYQY